MQTPPKFSSFARKSNPSASISEGGSDTQHARKHSRHGSSHRPHSRTQDERQHPRDHEAGEAYMQRIEKASQDHTSYKRSRTPEQKSSPGNDLFFVDIKGDSGNAKYDGPDKALIPTYRPTSQRRAIGYRATRPAPGRSLLSALSRNDRARLQRKEWEVEPMSEAPDFDDSEHDFVPLAAGTKRRCLEINAMGVRSKTLDGETGSESEESIEDMAQAGGPDNPSQQKDRDLSKVKGENARLSHLVHVQPTDAQAWQEYIDHQEDWLRVSHDSQGSKTALSRAVADLRSSLYTEAMVKLGKSHPARALFRLKLLEEGEKVWEQAKLTAKWEDALLREGDSLRIQLGYLNHLQRVGHDFDRCRSQYIEYLNLLGVRAAADRSDQTERQIYAVLRFTVMARDAGFNELAQNIWQGLLEVHFGAHSKGDLAERLQRVEDLWDSEASKIGDPVGQTRGKVQAIHTNIAEWSTSTPMQGRASISWAEQEVRLSKQQAGAGANASNSEDPLSIILFQDIQPFLFTVPSDKELIVVDAFLTFSGLPLLAADCPVPSSKWQTDPFIFGRPPSCSVSGGALDEQTILRPIPRTLLSRHHHHFKISDPAFVRRVLAHISHVRPQLTPLAEYYMAFMAHNFPDEARQEAKKVLKHSPLDLRLYNAMGLMEGVLGNPGAADKVLSSALQMCGKLSLAQQDDEVLLRLSWIWQAIAGQDSSTALARLRKVSEGAPAFEKLIQGRDRSMSRSQYHQACAYSEMLALEPYLVHDFDLASALAAFQGEAQHLISSDNGSAYSIELLHQARAMLIQHHVSHLKHFSPSLIRGALRQSVLRFPNNTPFLHLFMDNEARFIVDNRTRSSTRDVVLSDEPNVVSYTAYLQHQIRSLERFGATQHSIRSDFEQALASNHGKYSKTLWTMYFFFEVQVIHDWRRAKAVYYRGLNSVPWSKDFALLAFERLADVFEEGEYGEIYGLMQDRGMRLRAEWPEAT